LIPNLLRTFGAFLIPLNLHGLLEYLMRVFELKIKQTRRVNRSHHHDFLIDDLWKGRSRWDTSCQQMSLALFAYVEPRDDILPTAVMLSHRWLSTIIPLSSFITKTVMFVYHPACHLISSSSSYFPSLHMTSSTGWAS